jgi:hypothetical protein
MQFYQEIADSYYGRGKFFCSTACEGAWLDEHMTAIEHEKT